MKPFNKWKELRELVRMSAIHFDLSPEAEKVALDSALRAPVHAYACYKAIERSYGNEKPDA